MFSNYTYPLLLLLFFIAGACGKLETSNNNKPARGSSVINSNQSTKQDNSSQPPIDPTNSNQSTKQDNSSQPPTDPTNSNQSTKQDNSSQSTTDFNPYALHDAIDAEDISKVAYLIQAGADVNKKDWRAKPAHSAWEKYCKALEEYKEIMGADKLSEFHAVVCDAACKFGLSRDEPCPLPLYRAIRVNSIDIVEMLLQAGTDLEECKKCGTPLYMAIEGDKIEIALTLIRHNADPNKKCFRKTPLYQAIEKGDLAVVRALLDKGADPSCNVHLPFPIYLDVGRTPLEQAHYRLNRLNKKEIIALLEQYIKRAH